MVNSYQNINKIRKMKCDQVTGSCQNLSWSEYQLKDYGDQDNDGDNHNIDTGRALVETEPVRYQLEEIHLALDKENSEKVVLLIMSWNSTQL